MPLHSVVGWTDGDLCVTTQSASTPDVDHRGQKPPSRTTLQLAEMDKATLGRRHLHVR